VKNSEIIVILGASDNPLRPSYMAEKILRNKGYDTLNVTYSHSSVTTPPTPDITKEEKTITIFLKPDQQRKYYDYILSLNPTRIIFNPGSENEEFSRLAANHDIQVLSGCTIAFVVNSLL